MSLCVLANFYFLLWKKKETNLSSQNVQTTAYKLQTNNNMVELVDFTGATIYITYHSIHIISCEVSTMCSIHSVMLFVNIIEWNSNEDWTRRITFFFILHTYRLLKVTRLYAQQTLLTIVHWSSIYFTWHIM